MQNWAAVPRERVRGTTNAIFYSSIAALFALLSLSGCGAPMGPIAGGELDGKTQPWPDDWSFTDGEENILLQTQPDDPYSVTLWIVRVDDQVFVAAQSREAQWVQNILENEQVVLGVRGDLYLASGVEETDLETLTAITAAYAEKYEFDTAETSDDSIVFELQPRS